MKLSIAEKLHIWRLRRKLSLKELGEQSGIHPDQLCRMEKKNMSLHPDNLAKLLFALNLDNSDIAETPEPVIKEMSVRVNGRIYHLMLESAYGENAFTTSQEAPQTDGHQAQASTERPE